MKPVSVEWEKKDRYGRTVGKVLTLDGVDVCIQQILLGLAWHYKKYINEQPPEDRDVYSSAELKAKAEHLGIWLNEDPVPPWEWRHSKIR
jgi:endonuclease YncB( thermonuclease family)